MRNPYITVLTATYDRAKTLPRLADSLEAQSFGDFEWLVVDDGSRDGSPALLAKLSAAASHPVRVLRRENGGKHRAVNAGLEAAAGAWIFIVDSDDILPRDALEKLALLARRADSMPETCGLAGLKAALGGEIVGSPFPLDENPCDAASLAILRRVRGDKAEAFKTSILRRYPFPEFRNEKFLTEDVVWFRMARDGFKLLLSNDVLYLCEYRSDGLSSRSLEMRLKNPEGTMLHYSEALALRFPSRFLVREAANLVRFSLHFRRLKSLGTGMGYGRKALLALAFPIGAALAVADRLRLRPWPL
jgi:glycosyltransferase involved in cell wall biosynthesis